MLVSGTGFSREEACVYTLNPAAWRPTPSRLKPVLQGQCPVLHVRAPCTRGTGFSREEACVYAIHFVVGRLKHSRLKPVLQRGVSGRYAVL